MSNKIPANIIISTAEELWRDGKCVETSKNRGQCIDDIKRRHDGTPDNDPYCAQFVWVVADISAERAGVKNYVPKTAGARDLLERSKKVFTGVIQSIV